MFSLHLLLKSLENANVCIITKPKRIVLFSMISLSILSLALRGVVPEKTYVRSEIPASDVQTAIISYNLQGEVKWGVDDFTVDVHNWLKYDQNVDSSLYVKDGMLCLETVFENGEQQQYAVISRSLNITVCEQPIFNINISVAEGANYNIRFLGKDSLGAEQQVWWEASPLDDLSGKSRWEIHAVDLTMFDEQGMGSSASTLTSVEITLVNPHNHQSPGEKSLCISFLAFSERNLKVSRIPRGDAPFVSSHGSFQAVVIELPRQHNSDESNIHWAALTYALTSNTEFEYKIFLFSKSNEPLQHAEGAVFLSHETAFTDIYRLDAPFDARARRAFPHSEELTFIWSLLGNFSVAIVKRGFEEGGFVRFELNAIELMSSNEDRGPILILEQGQIDLMIKGTSVAVFVAPIALLVSLTFQLKSNFMSRKRFSAFLLFLFAYGVIGRLVVAPFTGHPKDMEVWTESVRLFYESGVVNIRVFPLPFTYYILLLAYSPYALLRVAGFQDLTFLAHTSGMVESIFIKVPFILSDILSFYFLLKIFNKAEGSKSNSLKAYAYSLVYFLSPLAIFLSGIWGMYDGIAVGLFLAGIYYTLFEEKPLFATLFYVLSGLTKGFGFLGFVPLLAVLMKNKKSFQFSAVVGMISGGLVCLPLVLTSGVQSIPELVTQFLRGRVGFGSNTPYVASSSYQSFLSILGFKVEPTHLTYLIIALVVLISVRYGLRVRNSMNKTRIELTLGYFAMIFFIFYLIFFRVYEQYYLWIVPILIMYSYFKRASGPVLVAGCITLLACPILLFGMFFSPKWVWLPLNFPVDNALVAVLPSVLVACGLLSIARLKGSLAFLKTGKGMATFAGSTLWFSFSLAYHACYGAPFLGALWYPASVTIVLIAAALIHKNLKSRHGLKTPLVMTPDA